MARMWMWPYDRKIWLSSAHIQGKANNTADFESRYFRQKNEWMLDKKKFFQRAISKLNFKPEIDLFASRNNCQIEKFVS